MAMALLCRRKGFFRYQLCARFFSSSAAQPSPTPFPFPASSSNWFPIPQHGCAPLAVSRCLRISERRFSTEATSYPTPAPPPGDFDDFPEAGDGDYDDDGGEDAVPAPDPDDGALYSPSESEN